MSDGFDLAIAIGARPDKGSRRPATFWQGCSCGRGLHLNSYNAFQSIVRGGHIFLTLRVSEEERFSHGDKLDMLLCLNQDTMNKHLHLMGPGSAVVYNSDNITPGDMEDGVQLCPCPSPSSRARSGPAASIRTRSPSGAIMHLLGMGVRGAGAEPDPAVRAKGEAVVNENVRVARAGFDHAVENFVPFPTPVGNGPTPLGVWSGNEALAMGGAAAGVKFYAAYPMSPSTGVLHWMAGNARNLGIIVRQVEDEIGVANMVIGAAHMGVRSMCATSGGGFALMTEAIGAASMMEIPSVFIDVQRAGPSTGVPTKTEQGDLWQSLGASQGDFQRLIVAPLHALDAFNTIPELFNLTDQLQCPGIVLSDLLISEGRFSVNLNALTCNPRSTAGS